MENKNELVESEEMMISNDNFLAQDNKKVFTTIDLNDDVESTMLLNALDDANFKLNDCVGKEITVTNIYVTEKEVESMDEESGEMITRKKHVLMLFDAEGNSYVTGSNACYNSFRTICMFKHLVPKPESPMTFKVIKTPAKQQGHTYLRLKFIK